MAQLVKNLLQCRGPWFDSWLEKIIYRRDRLPSPVFLGFSGGSAGKESACNVGDPGFDPWVRKIPRRREWLPTPVFRPGEFHGQDSLWGLKELDMTEQLSLSFTLNCPLIQVVHILRVEILNMAVCMCLPPLSPAVQAISDLTFLL